MCRADRADKGSVLIFSCFWLLCLGNTTVASVGSEDGGYTGLSLLGHREW